MRIGIDCRLAGHRHAGIGRYIAELVQRLPQQAPDSEWVLFFFDEEQEDEVLEQIPAKFRSKVYSTIVPIKHYSLAEQVKLPQYFNQENLDLLHVPHFNVPVAYNRKYVVTIHDLLWHEYRGAHVTTLPPLAYWFKYVAYRWITSQAVKYADAVLVPAQTIKQTVIDYYPATARKIIVTPEGVGDEWVNLKPDKALGQQLMSKFNIKAPFLVYVGSLYPHKNVKLVLRALKKLPQLQLVLVGSRSVFEKEMREYVNVHRLSEQVIFTGYLKDVELIALLGQADALVQPSLSEGFGLTGVEAMSTGVRLLASDIPIFKEIYQDQAVYFDPTSVNSMVMAYQSLQTHPPDLKAAQALARQYSWEKMAQQTYQTYLHAVSHSPTS